MTIDPLADNLKPYQVHRGLNILELGPFTFKLAASNNFQAHTTVRGLRDYLFAGIHVATERRHAVFGTAAGKTLLKRLIFDNHRPGSKQLIERCERQMLALAMALMSSPDLIMLDEPSLGLAPKRMKEVFDIIVKISEQGKTMLLAEQNAYASLKIADHACVLEVGSVVLEGNRDALISDPKVREAYLGG